MSPIATIEIDCELEPADGSIRGALRDRRGNRRDFAGWTELAAALMELIGDAEPPPTDKEQ